MTALTGYIKKDLRESNKNPKIRSMQNPNLANLTIQYQQAYLIYCYKIMQYLQALAWLAEQKAPQNQANIEKVKPKSASGVKKLAQEVNQQKLTFKSLKHQGKPNVSTIVAMGFPNGAMSAAFRVAFNETITSLNKNQKEIYDTSKSYDKFYKNLSQKEKNALRVAFNSLSTAQGIDKFNGSAGMNNVKGIGVFLIDEGYQFSDATNGVYDSGVMDNSPTVGWCFVSCSQSITTEGNKLSLLVYRHPNGFRDISVYSNKMQSYSNQAKVPVILYDAYFNNRFMWMPKQESSNAK